MSANKSTLEEGQVQFFFPAFQLSYQNKSCSEYQLDVIYNKDRKTDRKTFQLRYPNKNCSECQKDRQTGRQTEHQSNRQNDRQTDRMQYDRMTVSQNDRIAGQQKSLLLF